MPVPHALTAAAVALLLAPLTPSGPRQAPPSAASAAVERQWLDPNGDPLPLRTDEDVEEFLRTAQVAELEGTSRGVAGARKGLLRKGDIEMHAVFRTVAVEERQRQLQSRLVWFFRDHYIHEPAAYALSELLGLDMVPPSVTRVVRGRPGSLQIWLEGVTPAVDAVKDGAEPPDQRSYLLQLYQMQVFDNLINNIDRNQGNILIDRHWRLWLIDHTRAFIRDRKLPAPATVRRVERGLWEKLRTLSDQELEAAIEPYIPGPERAALLERRRLLVELIQGKIDLLGEEGVLFDPAELEARLPES